MASWWDKLIETFCPPTDPDEAIINHPYANATTPEEIVMAAIVQSFAKDFENWQYKPGYYSYPDKLYRKKTTYQDSDRSEFTLKNTAKNLSIIGCFVIYRSRSADSGSVYRPHDVKFSKMIVNNKIILSERQAQYVFESWIKLFRQAQEAARVAKEAKEVMERNEAAWQLAENLLGMKRNELGALVPAKKVEENA